MKNKPKILIFNKYYLPGYRAGGPIRTLENMVEQLSEDFDFHIVTLNRDAGEREPYKGIAHDCWNTVGKAKVMYLDPAFVSLGRINDIVSEVGPQVIYLNSFFDPTFTQRVLWARRLGRLGGIPIILAPRGEFSGGALRLKQVKKIIYIRFCAFFRLCHGLIWQASSSYENIDIRRSLSFVRNNDICNAMNIAARNSEAMVQYVPRKSGEPLRVCFLSRISRMKNLDFALRALAKVHSDVVFTIYGPKEVDAYWVECQALIEVLPSNVKAVYIGEVHPAEVRCSLAQHDLFFLPTKGENYGHVIYEALGAGLPVLLSDKTPWNDVSENGVGWTLPLDSESAFAEVVDEVASWSNEKMESARKKSLRYAMEHATNSDAINGNKKLFMTALSGKFF